MTNFFDPSNILATTIQSSAALIAIISGFSVSRFLNQRTEIEKLDVQLELLNIKISKYSELHSNAKINRILGETKIFIDDTLQYLKTNAKASDDELKASSEANLSEEEKVLLLDRLRKIQIEARNRITKILPNYEIPQVSEEKLIQMGFELDDIDKAIYLFVLRQIREERDFANKSPRIVMGIDIDAFSRLSVPTNYQMYGLGRGTNWGKLEDEYQETLQPLLFESSIYASSRSSRFKNLWLKHSILALSLILVFGIVIPAFFFIRNPIPASHPFRNLYAFLLIFPYLAGGYFLWVNFLNFKMSTLPSVKAPKIS